MKVVRLFEDDMLSYEREAIEKLGLDVEIEVRPSSTEEEVIKNAKDADIIITVYEPLTQQVLENLPKLKLVLYRSIGFNMVDMEYANKINLPVSHISQYCTDEVANYVMAAILMHNRRLNEFDKSVKNEGKWDCELFPEIRRLSSLTVGLIGFGNIPKLINSRLKSFGPRVIAYDPFVDEEIFAQHGVEKVSLEEIFSDSDYISSHLPLNPSTKESLNASLFNLTKKKPVFINSSRGGVVNEVDLYDALVSEKFSYAILDVLTSEEPDLNEVNLLKLDNVVITPHVAFYSQEAFIQGAQDNFKNVKAFLDGDYRSAEIVNLKSIEIDNKK